jgi:L-rhamnose mutarotase
MQRFGQIIKLKPGAFEKYSYIHEHVWPEVQAMITMCNMHNYSIFHRDGFLFAYFEYTGSDFAGDMARMAADPKTKDWWTVTDPLQEPIETHAKDEWWADMKEVFHQD